MKNKLPLPIASIIEELSFSSFIKDKTELRRIESKCKAVLASQEKKSSRASDHIEAALEFVQAIWEKYDCAEIADIYSKFVRIEEALFGLERDEKEGTRYREHFVHMFNCYVFGIRIISALLKQLTEDEAKATFKIEDENIKAVGLPFGENYAYRQRLHYLWTLIATFHDIAIPFQHLAGAGRGINKFVQEFGWLYSDPALSMKDYDASQLSYYFNLLAAIYGGGLVMTDSGRKYKTPDKPNYYMAKILGREFDNRNHSVLSGLFMWKTIEEIFLLNRSSKYSTGMKQFNLYTEYVLEQDIARAALAISMHSIGPDRKTKKLPVFFPVKFDQYPLTFLLILADELQDYLRWEGTTIKREIRFSSHPAIDLKVKKSGKKIIISLTARFSLDSDNTSYIVYQAQKMALHQKDGSSITNLDEAIDFIGKTLKHTLESKLYLGHGFNLKIEIFRDWTHQLFTKDFLSEQITETL